MSGCSLLQQYKNAITKPVDSFLQCYQLGSVTALSHFNTH